MKRARWIAGAVLLAATTTHRARAGETEQSIAAGLFSEGRALLEAGHVAQACEKLASSQRLDPAGGTLMNLAECRRREGRAATAHALYTEALAVARRDRRDDRIAVCQTALAALDGELSRVVVEVERPAPGLVVRLGGALVPRAAWGTPIAVDPGAVEVEARAVGRTPLRRVDVVRAGERKVVLLPPLEPARAEAAGEPEPALVALGAALRLDVDGRLEGAAGFVGPLVDVGGVIDFAAGPVLGPTPGVELGARVHPLRGPCVPYVGLATPWLVDDELVVGIRPALGLRLVPARGWELFAASTFAVFPGAPASRREVVFLPTWGASVAFDVVDAPRRPENGVLTESP